MRVRLMRKLAEVVDGIDLSHCAEGDVIQLSERQARLLVAEMWAEPVDDGEEISCVPSWVPDRAVAADDSFPAGRRHHHDEGPALRASGSFDGREAGVGPNRCMV